MERSKENVSARLKTMVENGFPTKIQFNDDEYKNELWPEMERALDNNGKFVNFLWADNFGAEIRMFVFSSDDEIGYFKREGVKAWEMITKREFSEIVLTQHAYYKDDEPYIYLKPISILLFSRSNATTVCGA